MLKKPGIWLLIAAATGGGVAAWTWSHPRIFNESVLEHAHCIKIAAMAFQDYADEHEGQFPFHRESFGSALLLLEDSTFYSLTGPCYSDAVFHDAKHAGTRLSEDQCGRIYIQGLNRTTNSDIAILFDRLATPGDHCPLPFRLWRPAGREVLFVDGRLRFVTESEWPEFAREQIEKLTQQGFPAEEAERLYSLAE